MSEQPPADPIGPPPGQGPPPPQPPYPPQYAYPYPVEPPATSKATTAMVLGICGLVVCPGALSIPAWILGQQAVREIDASGGRLGGRSQAQAGYILGIIGTVFAALLILAVVGLIVFSIALTGAVVGELDNCTTDETSSSFEIYCE